MEGRKIEISMHFNSMQHQYRVWRYTIFLVTARRAKPRTFDNGLFQTAFYNLVCAVEWVFFYNKITKLYYRHFRDVVYADWGVSSGVTDDVGCWKNCLRMAVCKKNVRSQETGHNFKTTNYYIRVIAGHGVIQTTLIRALNLEVSNIDHLCVVPCGYQCYLTYVIDFTQPIRRLS